MQKRSGIRLQESTNWPAGKTAIAITSQNQVRGWSHAIPAPGDAQAEGYRVYVEQPKGASPIVWVIGADPRGTLFGAGYLLRKLDWAKGKLSIDALDITTAPAYPIRGHQLGYRTQANSYDAWDAAQYEQYIRELAFFGVNSIENIPFHDSKALTGVFFPGGDPGRNPPQLVLPFLEDVAKRMRPFHANAKIWISLQWFTAEQIDFVYKYVDREAPEWFAGLVAGPSGPPIPETRLRLPKQYKLRLY